MDQKNITNIKDYNTARQVIENILKAVKREMNLRDYRDVTFCLSVESFIHFRISDNSVSSFKFEKENLNDLCEKLNTLYPDLGKLFTIENIEVTKELMDSFRKMAGRVKNKEYTKLWLTYHSVFGYYVFEETTCILKFTHEMFYKFCQQNSLA